jgi:hypothetical protein
MIPRPNEVLLAHLEEFEYYAEGHSQQLALVMPELRKGVAIVRAALTAPEPFPLPKES